MHGEIWRFSNRGLHGGAVKRAVGLRARPMHGGPFASVQQAKLDARGICHAPHQPVQRINFANQMPLANAANGRVA